MIYESKKAKIFYETKVAHRGNKKDHPENTIAAYLSAIENEHFIEFDIRPTKDNVIICFHDIKCNRLLNINGKIKNKNYNDIKDLYVLDSNEKIPTFKQALRHIDNQTVILIEIKGWLTKNYKEEVYKILASYNGNYYIHVYSIINYNILKNNYGKEKIIWISNIFRKRFNFIK